MRAPLHIILLLLFVLTGPRSLHAQPQPYTFDHLTTADGLATYSVNKIYQDRQGFMWFATNQGLQRYDGYRFTSYRHDEDDPASLIHDTVLALCEDHEGVLWVGTRDGLDRFDRATETFTHLSGHYVLALYVDHAGTVWIGTAGGLNRFDRATETFTHFQHDPEDPSSLSYDAVSVIHEDRSGVLWVGTLRGGLNRFDPDTETFTSYPYLNATYDPEVGRFLDTLEAGDRRLASILRVGEETSLTQALRLTQETTALVVAVGEGEEGMADYGWVENDAGDVVWQMVYDHTRHAGGSLKNRMQVGLVTLAPGAYRLHYRLDTGHAYGAWNADPPDHPERYGIQLYRVTAAEAERIDAYVSDDEPPQAVSGSMSAISEDRDGVLWLGTSAGLDRFDPKTETFTRYRHDPNDANSLSMGGVTAVQEDQDGMLWIGGGQGSSPYGSSGLVRFDPTTNTFTRFPYDPTDPDGFLGNRVQDVFVDRAGAVWVAAQRYGINRLDPSKGKFSAYRYDPHDPNSLSHHVVWAVHEGRDGMLWIGTDAGLDRLDRRTGRITHYTPDPADPYSLTYPQVKTLYEDRDGILWVGTWGGGLNRLDPATARFAAYRHDPDDSTTISLDRVEDILEDRQGTLWISTNAGFNRFDRATETFTRYTTKNTSFVGEPTGWIGVLFGAVYQDDQGVLWVSSMGGLNRFDRSTGRFWINALGMTGRNFVHTIEQDRAGRLWVGSEQGLFLVDRETGAAEAFTEADGLPNDAVMGIVSDEAGILWISTGTRGLVRFNPDTGAVRTYDLGDGLPSLNYNRTATFQSPSGEVFFAGPGGVVAFHPDRMRDNPYIPPVVLTGFSVRNEPVPVGAKHASPLRAHISVAEVITLAYDQNDVAFEFAALNYTNPEKNLYAYTLEGYDETWIKAGTSRRARYTNIPPGTYTLRVRGSNNDGVWNEEGASIRVTVLPPFWQTAWFRLFAIAALLAIAYAGYRWRIRSLEARSRMLEMQVAERTAEVRAQAERLEELDRVKSRFFANISHEFRTPLTLMLGPIKDVLDGAFGDVDERVERQHRMMHRNGRRLLRLINQLLDLSRLEAGHLTLRARRANVVPLVRATTQAFSSMAQRKNVTLHVDVPQQEILLYVEPDKIEKVLYNLLSNAFKFTPDHGKILVSVAEDDDDQDAGAVEIVVRDTGHGIPAEEVPFIFDRFYQVDASSTREQEGSGIGLALTKELVALHGGTVRVESKEGFGTAFFVRLPKGRAHLGDDDIVEAVAGDVVLEAMDAEASLQAVDDVLATDAQLYEHEGDGHPHPLAEDASVVLIVEDNADVRGYLRSHLAADYRIVEAVDGVEGLEQARATQPALILADVMMPHLDGYGLCRAVKADARLNHIPVVLLTARADEESKIEGLEAGADDYLYKPFNRVELVTRVENLIEIRRLLRSRFSGEVVVQPTAVTVPSADAIFLEQVREVVEAQMGDSHFTVERLAEEVGMSPRQLQRRLRELTKLTPSGYVRSMRLQRAAQLLEQQAGRVSEVAYAVGFQNAEHFSRLFQQVYGVAPSQYGGDQT